MRFRGHVLIFWICSHRISKAQVNDYSEKIEAIASKLVTPLVRDFFFLKYNLDSEDFGGIHYFSFVSSLSS